MRKVRHVVRKQRQQSANKRRTTYQTQINSPVDEQELYLPRQATA